MKRIITAVRPAIAFVIAASLGTVASAGLVQSYDFTSGEDGFTSIATSSFGAAGGFLTGVATNNDPQIRKVTGGIAPTAGFNWTTLEYRVRETNSSGGGFVGFPNASNPTGLIFGFNTFGTSVTSADYSFVNAGGGFTDVTIDLTGFGATTLNNFRLDPIGGALSNSGVETANNTFEIDFVRFNDSSPATAVPEPTSLALLGIAGIGAAFQRKRRQRETVS